MSSIQTVTGKTRKENEKFYISAINVLMSLGYSEAEARKEVQEAYKEAIKECI